MKMFQGTPGLLVFICSAVVALSSCNKRADTTTSKATEARQAKIDPCTLIQRSEIEALQHSPVTDTKSSENAGGDFRVAQCFYTTAEFNKSVSLAVIDKKPNDAHSRTPKQFWHETFDRTAEKDEKEEKGQGEEKERRTPPKKIEGVGDDAYWAANRFGGVLYVLKGDAFISISVGGVDNEQTKIDKCKSLAQKAIGRM
jgi:hypothetical protein